MTKMHVRNITGLPAVLDKFDDFARQTVVRAMAEAGITIVAGSFEKGAVVTSSNEGVYQESTGKVYSWFTDATITVPAGTTPQNFGGVNATAWVDRTDVTLRGELGYVDGLHDISVSVVIGDGVTDNRSQVSAANALGRPIKFVGVSVIGSALTITAPIVDTMQQIFSEASVVTIDNNQPVRPEWFG